MVEKPLESVWDYPRPPRVEAYSGLIEVHRNGYVLGGKVVLALLRIV